MRVRCQTTEINLINSDAGTMEMWPFLTHFDTHFALRNGHRIVFTPDSFLSFQNDQFYVKNQNIRRIFVSCLGDRDFFFEKQDPPNKQLKEEEEDKKKLPRIFK